ncbi:hypothetical protein Syun_021113 [Stephania yunnanensis]|uniref:Uncharacterized protein n=1 Tax=Stephania yunnanensis TaxID=152371 RepID=A0AAP0IGG6_9MAGN
MCTNMFGLETNAKKRKAALRRRVGDTKDSPGTMMVGMIYELRLAVSSDVYVLDGSVDIRSFRQPEVVETQANARPSKSLFRTPINLHSITLTVSHSPFLSLNSTSRLLNESTQHRHSSPPTLPLRLDPQHHRLDPQHRASRTPPLALCSSTPPLNTALCTASRLLNTASSHRLSPLRLLNTPSPPPQHSLSASRLLNTASPPQHRLLNTALSRIARLSPPGATTSATGGSTSSSTSPTPRCASRPLPTPSTPSTPPSSSVSAAASSPSTPPGAPTSAKSKIWLPEPNPRSADLRRELLYAASIIVDSF